MILTDKSLKDRLVMVTAEMEQARQWWRNGEWSSIGNRILIDPFDATKLGICSYDLSVGEEYVSLRDPYTPRELGEGKPITISPGETVLILTQEYVCLPKNVMAIVVPRARWIFEGTSICASRVDPTWYGKLMVGFSNLAKNQVALYRGEGFCTCYFMETTETEAALTADKVHFLGRTKIGRIEFTHAQPQAPVSPDKVTQSEIDAVVNLYGPPWDVFRGALTLTRKELGEWIEKEVTSDIVEQAASAAERRAFDELTKWNRNLIIGILSIGGAIAAAIVGALITYFVTR